MPSKKNQKKKPDNEQLHVRICYAKSLNGEEQTRYDLLKTEQFNMLIKAMFKASTRLPVGHGSLGDFLFSILRKMEEGENGIQCRGSVIDDMSSEMTCINEEGEKMTAKVTSFSVL